MTRRQFAMAAGVVSAAGLLLCAVVALSLLPGSAEATADQPRAMAQQLPPREWENYYGVTILPSGRGVVVGDKGIVMTTDDKGQTWTRQQLHDGTDFFNLYSVAFTPDGSQGWIVGDGGAIFHSADGGTTWSLQENKVPAALLKVAVLSPQNVCAVGEHGTVLCTGDGGNSWKLQKFEDIVFFDLAFADPQHGWAVGEFATVLNTVDGGKTWKVQAGGQRNISSDPYFAVAFTDLTHGLIFSLNGAFAVTADGGQTWKPGNLPADNKHSIYAAVTIPSGGGALYLGGADGALGSLQGGKMEAVAGVTANSITGLALSPTYGLAVGMAGTILRSEDGGQHWSSVTTGAASLKQAQAE